MLVRISAYHFTCMTSVFLFFFYSLFYLAKSCLHWVRKCGMNQTCLRTAELKLIRVCFCSSDFIVWSHCISDLLSPKKIMLSLILFCCCFRWVTWRFQDCITTIWHKTLRYRYHNMSSVNTSYKCFASFYAVKCSAYSIMQS